MLMTLVLDSFFGKGPPPPPGPPPTKLTIVENNTAM